MDVEPTKWLYCNRYTGNPFMLTADEKQAVAIEKSKWTNLFFQEAADLLDVNNGTDPAVHAASVEERESKTNDRYCWDCSRYSAGNGRGKAQKCELCGCSLTEARKQHYLSDPMQPSENSGVGLSAADHPTNSHQNFTVAANELAAALPKCEFVPSLTFVEGREPQGSARRSVYQRSCQAGRFQWNTSTAQIGTVSRPPRN